MLQFKVQISCGTELPQRGEQLNLDACQQAEHFLNNHFLPQMNEPFDAEMFRVMKPNTDETLIHSLHIGKSKQLVVVSEIWTKHHRLSLK
jgi:hypothetical protein